MQNTLEQMITLLGSDQTTQAAAHALQLIRKGLSLNVPEDLLLIKSLASANLILRCSFGRVIIENQYASHTGEDGR